MKRIFITGSPGVGKSTIAKCLANYYKIPAIDIAKLAIKKGFIRKYIKELKTFEINVNALKDELEKLLIKLKEFVLEGHIIEAVPAYLIDYVFILRLHPRILKERLLKRNYPCKKIKENILSEILDWCLITSLNYFISQKIHEIDTTNREISDIVNEIIEVIEGKRNPRYGFIDWISILEKEGLLDEYLS